MEEEGAKVGDADWKNVPAKAKAVKRDAGDMLVAGRNRAGDAGKHFAS